MTEPLTLEAIQKRTYLGPKNELLAINRYASNIESRGLLPLSLLNACAAHLHDSNLAQFKGPRESFYEYFEYKFHGQYSLIDSRGASYIMLGDAGSGRWSVQLPTDGSLVFNPPITNAA